MKYDLKERDIERFKLLNIEKFNDMGILGEGIKIGILGYGGDAHHDGKWLIQQGLPNASIYEYNVMTSDNPPRLSWEEALEKAINDNVDIIISSLRKLSWNDELDRLCKTLYDKGVIMIDSADNQGRKINRYPADCEEWFVVGALSGLDRADYSNYGDKLDFLMYTDFYSMTSDGRLLPITHTSGCPQVCAVIVGILKEYLGKDKVNPEYFKNYTRRYCQNLKEIGKDEDTGYGLLMLPSKVKETEIVMTIDSIEYTVNGEKKYMDTAPIIQDDRTFVPVKFIIDEFGDSIGWNGNTRQVTITRKELD